MKIQEYPSCGVNAKIWVAETSEEFNKLDPSRPDACVAEANDGCVFRGCLADIRWEYAVALEKATGIKMKREGKVDSKNQPVMKDGVQEEVITESEAKFAARVYAETNKPAADFQYLMDEVCQLKDSDGDLIAQIDPTKKERKAKATGPGKRVLADAALILKLVVDEPKKYKKVMKMLNDFEISKGRQPIAITGDNAVDVVIVATAYDAWQKAQSIFTAADKS